MIYTPEWWAFWNAKERCTNPKHKQWKNYGGRGIEFRFESREEFRAELGPRPEGYVLDRKDNDGHYEPGNVRWATRSESNRNRRSNTEAQIKQRNEARQKIDYVNSGHKGGLIGGKIQGRRNAENKIGVCGRSFEKMSKDGKKSGYISAHLRWHAARDIVNPLCALCRPDFFDLWEA